METSSSAVPEAPLEPSASSGEPSSVLQRVVDGLRWFLDWVDADLLYISPSALTSRVEPLSDSDDGMADCSRFSRAVPSDAEAGAGVHPTSAE